MIITIIKCMGHIRKILWSFDNPLETRNYGEKKCNKIFNSNFHYKD